MPLMFRSMLRDGDGPLVGPRGDALGVRVPPDPHPDVHPDGEGKVRPGQGGMSVGRDWRELPPSLIPKSLRAHVPDARGSNKRFCWHMGSGGFEAVDVANGLKLRHDHGNHGLVEPSDPMHVDDFQRRIAATHAEWALIPEESGRT